MAATQSGAFHVVLSPSWSRPLCLATKRCIDVVVAASLILALSPILLALSIAVKLSSKGPVFFHWRVVGLGGQPFVGYKFRSMVANAETLRSQLSSQNEMSGPVFKMSNDPRVTKLGSWMRRYSLDELPQLYSVLKGDMSLVGPRPPLVMEYAEFSEFQKQKLLVKPGITCLWQVNGRNNVSDFNEWVGLDLKYIREWSLYLDFKILLFTVREVFAASGK